MEVQQLDDCVDKNRRHPSKCLDADRTQQSAMYYGLADVILLTKSLALSLSDFRYRRLPCFHCKT